MAVLNPTAATLTLSAQVPVINKGVCPALGTLTLTGSVPGLGRLEPTAGQLRLIGYPPIVEPVILEDQFNRVDVTGLGNQWQQVYNGLGAGTFKTDDGRARWFLQGNGARTVRNKLVGINQLETIALQGDVTDSTLTFTLTFQGQTTAPISIYATPAQVQAALEALPNVNPGDVEVRGR